MEGKFPETLPTRSSNESVYSEWGHSNKNILNQQHDHTECTASIIAKELPKSQCSFSLEHASINTKVTETSSIN